MNKKFKIFAYLTIVSIFLLSGINTSIALATDYESQETTFNLDTDNPQAFGVIIPRINMYGTYSIQGSNQGRFEIMPWDGSPSEVITVNNPGEDISLEAYPQYFDYITKTPTKNNFIDPWQETRWFNISAYNSEVNNTQPYTLSSIYEKYAMNEYSQKLIQLSDSMPVEINLNIENVGPKVLKLDWDTTSDPVETMDLISPSGIPIYFDYTTAEMDGSIIFYYIPFVAKSTGIYKLLLDVDSSVGNVFVDFIDSNQFYTPVGASIAGGSGGEFPTQDDIDNQEWTTEWFSTTVSTGQKLKINIIEDYDEGFSDFNINLWLICGDDYYGANIGTTLNDLIGTQEMIFPNSGKVYFSISGTNLYRIILSTESIASINHNLGTSQSIKIEKNERKAMHFSLNQDSFVRFNYTLKGLGSPRFVFSGLVVNYIFYHIGQNQRYCTNLYDNLISSVQSITENGETYYYYYMPRGSYHLILVNQKDNYDGTFGITSKLISLSSQKIPVNDLYYPNNNPSDFSSINFEPSEYNKGLKEAKVLEIDIDQPGQYRLNTTMLVENNTLVAPSLTNPLYVYIYNATTDEFIPYDNNTELFANDTDYLYIGYESRWNGMDISLSKNGSLDGDISMECYCNPFVIPNWRDLNIQSDSTNELNESGEIEFRRDLYFQTWIKGADGLNIDDNIEEEDYYWLRIDPTSSYSIPPIISSISLKNITITGNINFALIGTNGYIYDEYWKPTTPDDITNFEISQDTENLNSDTDESYIIYDSDPYIRTIKPGTYKLLIIPNHWDCFGGVTINFALENYLPYAQQYSYDIENLTPTPELYAYEINNYTDSGYANNNGSVNNYGLNIEYNYTETILSEFGGDSYLLIECKGESYQWTQLVVYCENISSYDLRILQDLPWVSGSSSSGYEVKMLDSSVSTNRTFEFGVLKDNFYLLFEVDSSEDMIKFGISLSQYDTQEFIITTPSQESQPFEWLGIIIIAGAVGMVALIGAVGYYFIRSRGGKIKSKSPR